MLISCWPLFIPANGSPQQPALNFPVIRSVEINQTPYIAIGVRCNCGHPKCDETVGLASFGLN